MYEKVNFESLPGFYVTANLYRPNQAGRYPGVLLQAGHTQEGKPEGRRLAANLALIVPAFDPWATSSSDKPCGAGFRSLSPHRPSVFARYSTIAFASASDARAPRAIMFCTIAFQSFSLIRWLVTTSTE